MTVQKFNTTAVVKELPQVRNVAKVVLVTDSHARHLSIDDALNAIRIPIGSHEIVAQCKATIAIEHVGEMCPIWSQDRLSRELTLADGGSELVQTDEK